MYAGNLGIPPQSEVIVTTSSHRDPAFHAGQVQDVLPPVSVAKHQEWSAAALRVDPVFELRGRRGMRRQRRLGHTFTVDLPRVEHKPPLFSWTARVYKG
jgi:hypothetical protein